LDPLFGPIGGGLALAAGTFAGAAAAVVEELSDEAVAGGVSSAALTTSLEPKLLIGKKDTMVVLFEEPPPIAAGTLAVRINPVAADVIAICAPIQDKNIRRILLTNEKLIIVSKVVSFFLEIQRILIILITF
jgi:hypothetical protein